jgi:hypothetical protein
LVFVNSIESRPGTETGAGARIGGRRKHPGKPTVSCRDQQEFYRSACNAKQDKEKGAFGGSRREWPILCETVRRCGLRREASMLPTILSIAGIGFVTGLVLVHWLTLAFVCLAGTLVFALASQWDWLLLPKWFALLTAFQLAYLAGAAVRVWLAGADRSKDESPAMLDMRNARSERMVVSVNELPVAANAVEEGQAASSQAVGPARAAKRVRSARSKRPKTPSKPSSRSAR